MTVICNVSHTIRNISRSKGFTNLTISVSSLTESLININNRLLHPIHLHFSPILNLPQQAWFTKMPYTA